MALVGVLGYQGGGDLHLEALKALGIPSKKIRVRSDLERIGGLILPGGESSVQYRYCVEQGLVQAIQQFAATGKPILGTCAGAILLSRYVSEKVKGFGILEIEIQRNTYGRQIASGIAVSDQGTPVLFIRAPGITSVGSAVEVLKTYQGAPILVRQAQVYAATYHPEALSLDHENVLYTLFGSYSQPT